MITPEGKASAIGAIWAAIEWATTPDCALEVETHNEFPEEGR